MNWLQQLRHPVAETVRANEIPRRYRGVTLDLVKHRGLRELAERYQQEFWTAGAAGLAPLCIGPAGTYKTLTAACIATWVRETAWIDVGWCNCADEFDAIDRALFAADTARRLHELKTLPFVVLDDFAQVAQNRQRGVLQAVVNARYDNCLPTLFTANLETVDQLLAEYGPNVQRRVYEMSEGFRMRTKHPKAPEKG